MRRPENGLLAILAVLALGSLPSTTRAQGTWDVMLNVDPFPSPYYSDWNANPDIGSLTVMNHTASPEDVRIFFTITDGMNRVLARGTGEPETIAAGAVVIYDSPYELAGTGTHDAALERIAARTGRLPEGDYTACAAAVELSGFVLAEACADFFIAYPDPPLLLAPENGMAFTDEAPLFQWAPVRVPIDYQLSYSVRIVELLPGQLPGEALASNIPVHEEHDAFGTALRYPIGARPLEPGKTYAWSVRALDQNGYTALANEGLSEIWTFAMEDPVQTPVTTSGMTVTMAPGSELGAAVGDEGGSLRAICLLWDTTPASSIRVPLNVVAAFSSEESQSEGMLYRDLTTHSWALMTAGQGASASYLLYGQCGEGVGPGGLRWIARRAGSFEELGLTLDGTGDAGEEPNALSAADANWRFGVLILALDATTVGDLPDTFEAPREFLGYKEIEVLPGVNLYAELELGSGPAGTVLEMFGHDDPYVALQGFVGAGLEFSVGGHIGQGARDSLKDSRFDTGATAEVEATILSLKATLPRRLPMLLGEWIDSTQVAVKLDVKAKGNLSDWHGADGSWAPGLEVEGGLGFSLALRFAQDTWLGGLNPDGSAVEHTATLRFKKQLYKSGDSTSTLVSGDGLSAVIKLESDRQLDRFAPVIFNSPETEVEIELARPFKGLDGVKVKVTGQVGSADHLDLGKGTLELSWPKDGPGGEKAKGVRSRGDSIQANIDRLESQQKTALERGATAEAESLGKQLDLERNALVSWEMYGAKDADNPSEPKEAAGRSLHWKVELALGNMSLSDMLGLVRSAVRRVNP